MSNRPDLDEGIEAEKRGFATVFASEDATRGDRRLPGQALAEVAGTVGAREAVDRLAELIRSAGSVVALTGAGISVPSGIPDFRTPGTGLWENVNPMEVAHIAAFRRDPVRFWHFYGDRFTTLEGKRPNGAHRALVELEERGLLDAVITQNIDRLHRRAGSRRLVEVHGTIEHSSCLACRARYPLEEVRARLAADADGVPRCDCGEALKPDVVLFGELLPDEAMAEAYALAAGADLLLCIGSSLEVHPVAGLPQVTLGAGGRLAIVTQGSTPFDRAAAVGSPATWSESSRRSWRRWARSPAALRARQRRRQPLDRRLHGVALLVGERSAHGRVGGVGHGATAVAQLGEALGHVGDGRRVGQLRQPRLQRDAQPQRRLPGATAVEVGAGAQQQLLAGEHAVAAGQQRRHPLLGAQGGRAPAARGRRRAPSPRSVQRPSATCSPRPYPTRATSAWPGETSRTCGSAAATRCASIARLSTADRAETSAWPSATSRRAASQASPAASSASSWAASTTVARPVATASGSGRGSAARVRRRSSIPAPGRAHGLQHHDVLDRLLRGRSQGVAAVVGPQGPGELQLDEREECWRSRASVAVALARGADLDRVLRGLDRDVGVGYRADAVDQLDPLAGLEDRVDLLAQLGVGAVERPESDVDVVGVVGHRRACWWRPGTASG